MLAEQYEYYSKFGWASNPFTLTISPSLMVGYAKQCESLLSHIHNSHKFASIIGPTGSGKSTMLLWLRSQLIAYKEFIPFYVPKPPRSAKNLINLFKSIIGYTPIDRILYRNLNLFNLSNFINHKTHDKKLILLIDEAHEASIPNLEWIRTLVDSTSNTIIILAALPVFEKIIETKIPTLFMRITTKSYLNNLSRSEVESLILKRIESVNGRELKPFTSSAVDQIYEITGGFPREIIKTCDKLIKEAALNNVPLIEKNFVNQVIQPSVIKSVEFEASLSKKQFEILHILNANPNISPTKIVDNLDINSYKNRNNAIRSINNILKRLLSDGYVQRKKLGNMYVYNLTPKSKTVLSEA